MQFHDFFFLFISCNQENAFFKDSRVNFRKSDALAYNINGIKIVIPTWRDKSLRKSSNSVSQLKEDGVEVLFVK